jgi:hypothetical protein
MFFRSLFQATFGILFMSLTLAGNLHSMEFQAGNTTLNISDSGYIDRMLHREENLIFGKGSPLLQIRLDGSEKLLSPTKAAITREDASRALVHLSYPNGVEAFIDVKENEHYLRMRLKRVESTVTVNKVIWGPYRTTMSDPHGAIAGILYQGDYSFVLQSLNAKTVGGQEDRRPTRDNNTARGFDGGSQVEAFSIDRTRPVTKDAWSSLSVKCLPVPGETVIGSSIALFGSDKKELVKVFPLLEKQEKLPSPKLMGEWNKVSWFANSTRLRIHFSEANIDQCIALAKACGVKTLYHPEAFSTWGHFTLNRGLFPNGRAGLKACVEKAEKEGVILGIHTLSNFITINDAYITPKPHPNLAVSGVTRLAKDLEPGDRDIQLADDAPIDIYRKQASGGDYEGGGSHKVLRIGDELIYFDRVSEQKPWTLHGCQRGWNGTKAARHRQGSEVAKLISHPYKVFFPDMNLLTEMAENLADLVNETGIKRMSFDGFEGCYASGHGKYGCNRFATAFYQRLKDKNFSLCSSITTNYFWHILSFESWGEPWTGGFRASHFDYRLKSIATLNNNLIPFKLGQFNFGQANLGDINWLMGFSAGHNAGVDLYISPDVLDKPGQKAKVEAIRDWTSYRREGSITPAQRLQLQNPLYEFTLMRDQDGELTLGTHKEWKTLDAKQAVAKDSLVWIDKLYHTSEQREPGQPTNASWDVNSPKRQLFKCQIKFAQKSEQMAETPRLQLGAQTITWKGTLSHGDYIHVTGKSIQHFRNGKMVSSTPIETVYLDKGKNTLEFDYSRKRADAPGPRLQIDVLSPGVSIKAL